MRRAKATQRAQLFTVRCFTSKLPAHSSKLRSKMCGIAGILNSGLARDDLELRLQRIERDLRHRGPDDSGQFVSKNGVAGLVSTRLAIQDLSAAGHQPMTTADGRYTIVFNVEIYNFKHLRSG